MKNHQINKGLHHALVIDDTDSSMSYLHSSTDNIFKPTIEQIYDMFKQKPDTIFSINTFNAITLILNNGTEVSLNEYKDSYNIDKFPLLLKIHEEELVGNDILIAVGNSLYQNSATGLSDYAEHYITGNLRWQNSSWTIQEEIENYSRQYGETDYNGYYNSLNISNLVKERSNIINNPAINYCMDCAIEYKNNKYVGYLPAGGQLKIFFKYIDIVNYIFQRINVSEITDYNTKWWSSSENMFGTATALSMENNKIEFEIYPKIYNAQVIPFFKKIK